VLFRSPPPPRAPTPAKTSQREQKGREKQEATRKAKAERAAAIKAQRERNVAATARANANARAKRTNTKATKKTKKQERVTKRIKKNANAAALRQKTANTNAAAAAKRKRDADAAAAKRKKDAKQNKAGSFLAGPMGALGSALSALGKLAGDALNKLLDQFQSMMPNFGGAFGDSSENSGNSGSSGFGSVNSSGLSGNETCTPEQKSAKSQADAARAAELIKIKYSTSTQLNDLKKIDAVWKKAINAANITGDCSESGAKTAQETNATIPSNIDDPTFLKAWKACIDYIDAPPIGPYTNKQSIVKLIQERIKVAYTDSDKSKIYIAARVIFDSNNVKRYLALLKDSEVKKVPLFPPEQQN
jgi:hypothetical protein